MIAGREQTANNCPVAIPAEQAALGVTTNPYLRPVPVPRPGTGRYPARSVRRP
jgi:hypothetical protein